MGKPGIKTLTALGTLMGRGAAANEERLLSFIAVYQRDNAGATPTYGVMANQLNILEEGVRILLARLENKGKVHFISRNPPRLMLCDGSPLPHEPTAADMAAAQPGAYGRYLDAEAERHRLGRYIATTEKQHGRGPSLREMVDFVGWAQPARVQRMAEMLAEKGLVQFGHGVPTRLTELGRQFYGVKEQVKMEQKTAARPVVICKARTPRKHNMERLCHALASHLRDGGGNYIKYSTLGLMLGYSKNSSAAITDLARAAMHAGYIQPKLPKHHGLFFTEKGLRKFMPETVAAPPPQPAPEPEITFTDRVPEDSPLRDAARQVFSVEDAQRAGDELIHEFAGNLRAAQAVNAANPLSCVETAALIMELIERGYTVRKG